MAVIFKTNNPTKLLADFNTAIENSKIATWERSQDGIWYTHKAANWRALAWFKATVDNASCELRFNIAPSDGKTVGSLAYAYYHGHLIESFLSHFDSLFNLGQATAMPTSADQVT